MTKVDRLIEIDEYIAYLDAVRTRIDEKTAPGTPVTILGFSQGGATAARWGCFGSRPAIRVIIWGSFLPPDLDLDNSRFRRMALTMVHGRRDPLVTAEQIAREHERVAGAGIVCEWIEFDGAHSIDPEVLGRLF